MALSAVGLVGLAGAAPTTDTTAVDFVTIPAKTVWGANSIPANGTESAIVIGGSTTVPSNATTVRLSVTVKGAAAGTLKFFPAGNPAGGAGHTLSWTAGGTATTTTNENIGTSNKVSVQNVSTKPATVTLKITGYSTQVTAGDINGSGGDSGDALINNGSGGVVWGTPGRAFASYQASSQNISFGGAILRSLTLPAGSYALSFNGTVVGSSATPDFAHCFLLTPTFVTIVNGDASVGSSVPRSTVAMQGLVTLASGGQVHAFCWSQGGQAMSMHNASLLAQPVGTVDGSVSTASAAKEGPAKKGPPSR